MPPPPPILHPAPHAPHSRRYFCVGEATDEATRGAVLRESRRHGDIAHLPLVEDYYNLTLKTIRSLVPPFHSHLLLR